ncbi:sialidase family protein [Nonomuraea zeae]|nr:sialidase family protein [Nonomuraea zeae]
MREPSASERLDFAGFPNVSALDVAGPHGAPAQKVITTFTTNVDQVVTLTNEAAVSTDGGLRFGPSSATPLREAPIQLLDGRFFATEYYPRRTGPHTATLGILTSSALHDGESWVRSEAVLRTPGDLLPGGAAHGVPIQLADGTILVTVYARYSDTGAYQAEVYASRDGGRTFDRRGVIAPPEPAPPPSGSPPDSPPSSPPAPVPGSAPSPAPGAGAVAPATGFVYNEASIAQTVDGSLLAVLRRDGGRFSTLHQTRSADGGRTWAPVRELRFSGLDCVVRGVAPKLLLTPGGLLVLSAGRPDNWLAVSPDGLGDEWREPRVTYHNRDGIWGTHGSSGYTGIAAVGPHRLIQVFDNCKLPGVRDDDGLLNETACPAHGRFENGGWYAIKRHLFTLTPPASGRLDLAAMRRRGELEVETTMRWTARDRRRTGPGGALDGSTGYWSSAVARGRGRYVLHLDRPHALTLIGLSLRPGHAASARVYVSGNGRSWGEPIVTITGRTDYALRYDSLARTARHVKIVTEPSAACEAEIGKSCSMLNEVELYAS